MDLPTKIELVRCATGAKEFGEIETLDRESAKTEIDSIWWRDLDDLLRDPNEEPDRHWEWRVIVSKHQNKPAFRAKCVRALNSTIQAAMLFRVDAMSALDAGQRAVFVDRLATAPHNRHTLVREPVFRGAGSGLILYAIALSYSLGFSGRVNLIAVANQDFYQKMGFETTSVIKGDDVLFEIPASVSMDLLKLRGLIDG